MWYLIVGLIGIAIGLFLGYFTLKSILRKEPRSGSPPAPAVLIEQIEEYLKDDIEAKETIEKLKERLGYEMVINLPYPYNILDGQHVLICGDDTSSKRGAGRVSTEDGKGQEDNTTTTNRERSFTITGSGIPVADQCFPKRIKRSDRHIYWCGCDLPAWWKCYNHVQV